MKKAIQFWHTFRNQNTLQILPEIILEREGRHMSASDQDTTGPDQHHKAGLLEGRLLLQRDPATGNAFFYPRVVLPGAAGALAPDWFEAHGTGTVYSTTVSRRRPEQGGNRNIAVIELAEGPRLLSQVVGIAPEQVRIGMAVCARCTDRHGR